jgi:hypothetical protein
VKTDNNKKKEKKNMEELKIKNTTTIKCETLPIFENINIFVNNKYTETVNTEKKSEIITGIYSKNKTIVILKDRSKGISSCSPLDKFDYSKGFKIALYRAQIKSLKKELKKLTK